MNPIVFKPRMSEKTYAQSSDGVYVFDVDTSINKHTIARAIESAYGVTVVSVRTVTNKGKEKRLYRSRRTEKGVRSDVKKAYVTLKKGESLPIFAAVEEAEEQDVKASKKAEKNTKENSDKKAGGKEK